MYHQFKIKILYRYMNWSLKFICIVTLNQDLYIELKWLDKFNIYQ